VFVTKPFTDYTDADFDMVTGVNLRGFFSVTRQAIAAVLRNKAPAADTWSTSPPASSTTPTPLSRPRSRR
jgi:NAD(P)-dependent dehydrogenase (short-subunit alcohol dehydrogenase family)